MCGRVVIHTPMGTLFDSVAGHALQASARPARFTVAPRSTLSIVTDNDERRVRDTAAWGFIPVWSTDPSRAPQPINARAATVATSRLFKRAFEQRRCLLPVDGFYEWQTRAGARKQPYCMHRSDGEPLALAGLWELWSGSVDGREATIQSATIITTAANQPMQALHDRMPVILERADWDAWLAPAPEDPAQLQELLRPAPDDLLEWHAVTRAVGNVRNDGPELIESIEE